MKMLIIEDDDLYVGILERYLEGLTDELIIVENWEDAEKHIPVASIIWADLVIPPHDRDYGILKIGQIRKGNEKAVIFVVSGAPGQDVKLKAESAGADLFVEKAEAIKSTQVIALMISALLKAHERGNGVAVKFLQKARQLLSERVNPQPPKNP